MSVNKAVRQFNTDIDRLTKAKEAATKANQGLDHAQKTEKSELASIAQQKTAIEDAFENAPTTPLTQAQQTADLKKMYQLGQKQVQTTDAFHAASTKDQATIKKDASTVASDRKTSLTALKPAEEHLNLKDTNQARAKLDLKPVSKVIRPPETGGTKAASDAEHYLGKNEAQLQAEGVTLPCPTGESCANFVSSMLVKAKASDFRTLGVADLAQGLKDRGWKEVPLKDAKPGDVWICNDAKGAPTEQHTELVASNKNGHVTLVGSNNISSSMQEISYDSSSANIEGSYILSPP